MFDNGKKKPKKKTHFLIVYKNELAYSRRVISIVDSFIHGRIYTTFVFVVLFFFKENEICHICRKEFEACEEQYPCRICDKVFHKDCVLSLKELHPSHLTAIKRANTSVGWSCPECVRFSIYKAFIL